MSINDISFILIAGLGSIAAFVYYVANLAEDGIKPESKKKFQKIVSNFKATPTFRHSFITFTMISEVFFGERIIGLKAFVKSAILSLSWMCLILAVCAIRLPKYQSWLTQGGIANLIIDYGLILVGFVVVVDYISVCVTRTIVKRSKPKDIFTLLFSLAVDLFISILIFYIGFSAIKYVVINPSWQGFWSSLSVWLNLDQLPILLMTLNDLTSDMLQKQPDGSIAINGGLKTEIVYAFPEGVVFYSSILTSIWLWLHIISYIVFKASVSFDVIKVKFLAISNFEVKPFKSLAIIVLVVYAALIPVMLFSYTIIKIWL